MLFDERIRACRRRALEKADELDRMQALGRHGTREWFEVGNQMMVAHATSVAWRISRMLLVVATSAIGSLLLARLIA